MSDENLSGDLAAAIAAVDGLLEPIMEATTGYKAKALRAGLNEEAASRCAADYHGVLMEMMKTQAFGSKR